MSASHPLTIAWVKPLKTVIVDLSNEMLEERGSDYRIEWTEAFARTLYNFNETLEAVSTQLTDMGWIGSLIEPSGLPLQNIMYSTPFVTETVELSCCGFRGHEDRIVTKETEIGYGKTEVHEGVQV